MSQSDEHAPPRRLLFFPVVIATLLLSIIGMSAGLVLGSRHDRSQAAGRQTSGQQATDQQISDPQTDGPTSDQPPTPTVSGAPCPPQMHETARKVGFDVSLVKLLVVKVPKTGTTVWICQDEDRRLYYQANRGGSDNKWVEGETALFLSDVVEDRDGYLATAADGNTFFVNKYRLEVVKPGDEQTYDVDPG